MSRLRATFSTAPTPFSLSLAKLLADRQLPMAILSVTKFMIESFLRYIGCVVLKYGDLMGAWHKIPRIHALIKQYGASIFVETGIGKGDGISAAVACGFEEIYSVDVFKKAADKARERFAKRPEVVIVEDNSEHFLNSLLPSMNHRPIFFWLDAHFPGEYHGVSRNECKDMRIRVPIKYELEIIFRERAKYNFPDIICIDDLKIFHKDFRLQRQGLVKVEFSEIRDMMPEGLACDTYHINEGYIVIKNIGVNRFAKMFF